MSARLQIACRVTGCHGFHVVHGHIDGAAIAQWSARHDLVCPLPEPSPLAELRERLLLLEEADDPDYETWAQRVETEIMPAATLAAFTLAGGLT